MEEHRLRHLAQSLPEQCRIVEVSQLTGEEVVQCVVLLSVITLPAVTKVIVELIRAKRHCSVKVDGNEVRGISEENVSTVLRRLIDARAKGGEKPESSDGH